MRKFITVALILMFTVLTADFFVRFGIPGDFADNPDPLNPGPGKWAIVTYILIAGAGLIFAFVFLRMRGASANPFRAAYTSPLAGRLDQLFSGRTDEDIVSAVIVSLCMHIAKVDGRISKSEIDAIRASLSEHFISKIDHSFMAQVAAATKDHLGNIFEPSRGPRNVRASAAAVLYRYEAHVKNRYDRKVRKDLLRFLILILYETLIADESVDEAEAALFDFICGEVGLRGREKEELKKAAWFNHYRRGDEAKDPGGAQSRRRAYEEQEARRNSSRKKSRNRRSTGPSNDFEEALELFGLDRRYTAGELDKAWKKMAMRHHPDRFHGQSPEIVAAANERFIAYRGAYEDLRARIN